VGLVHRSAVRVFECLTARPWLALSAAFGLSWASGAALAGAPPTVTVAGADAGEARSHEGGMTAPVDIAIASARSVAREGGEGLVLDVALTNKLGNPAVARYGVEVVTDRGKPVLPAARSPRIDQARAAEHRASVEVPAGLADGYYVVRVTAAAADGALGGSQIAEVYLRADAGALHEVDSDEYFARSRANQGVR
jgi:hypothetical protein